MRSEDQEKERSRDQENKKWSEGGEADLGEDDLAMLALQGVQ